MKQVSSRLSFLAAAAAILLSAAPAFAGKPERDKADALKPVADGVQATLKNACGCDIRVGIKFDSFAKADDMQRIEDTLKSLETAGKDQCEKPADKKAVCDALAEVEISYQQNESSVKLDGKKIIATTSEYSYSTDAMFKTVMNQF